MTLVPQRIYMKILMVRCVVVMALISHYRQRKRDVYAFPSHCCCCCWDRFFIVDLVVDSSFYVTRNTKPTLLDIKRN